MDSRVGVVNVLVISSLLIRESVETPNKFSSYIKNSVDSRVGVENVLVISSLMIRESVETPNKFSSYIKKFCGFRGRGGKFTCYFIFGDQRISGNP